MIKNKKAVSPVIATVLLIVMVVVIALIVFMWFKGLTKEAITKFDGQNIELVCDDVYFEASYSSGKLFISNLGNVPIFRMKMKVESSGSHSTEEIAGDWPEKGLDQGGVFSDDVSYLTSGADKIILIPVLIGESESGEKSFVCEEEKAGYEIVI